MTTLTLDYEALLDAFFDHDSDYNIIALDCPTNGIFAVDELTDIDYPYLLIPEYQETEILGIEEMVFQEFIDMDFTYREIEDRMNMDSLVNYMINFYPENWKRLTREYADEWALVFKATLEELGYTITWQGRG